MDCTGQNSPLENHTALMEFILIGFSEIPKLQGLLFGIFLIIYIFILMGNSLILMITKVDLSLKTPMYFFLGNFTFLEICYVSVIVPRLLTDLSRQHGNISLLACAIQMYFFLILVDTECFILTAMAYDRYVAICNPLLYPVIMNDRLCVQLAVASWTTAIPIHTLFISVLFSSPFCEHNQLNHFFCDVPPVVQLVCGDTFLIEMLIYVIATLVVTVPFVLILGSYVKIVSTILRLPSATGRTKAFSTCSSHLMVVTLFFGSGIIVYFRPKSTHSTGMDKFFSFFNTILTPVFNPIIYCLRNKDVMMALGKLLQKSLTLIHKFLK